MTTPRTNKLGIHNTHILSTLIFLGLAMNQKRMKHLKMAPMAMSNNNWSLYPSSTTIVLLAICYSPKPECWARPGRRLHHIVQRWMRQLEFKNTACYYPTMVKEHHKDILTSLDSGTSCGYPWILIWLPKTMHPMDMLVSLDLGMASNHLTTVFCILISRHG